MIMKSDFVFELAMIVLLLLGTGASLLLRTVVPDDVADGSQLAWIVAGERPEAGLLGGSGCSGGG